MKLRWKEFERSLRRHVRRKVRSSPALRLEARRNRKARHYHLPPWSARFLFAFLFFAVNAWGRLPIATLAAIVLLWSIGTIFWRSIHLVGAIQYSQGLDVYRFLPLSDNDIFTIRWRKFLRTSAWSLVDLGAGFAVLAMRAGYGPASALTLGLWLAGVQCLVVVALAVFLALYRPRLPFPAIGTVMMLSAIGLLFTNSLQTALTAGLAFPVRCMPGLGWILYALGIAAPANPLGEWLPALATALAICSLDPLSRKLRRRYRVPEFAVMVAPQNPKGRPNPQPQEDACGPATGDQPINAAARILDLIRTREFLAGPDMTAVGRLDRLAARCLTPREMLATEFLGAGETRWTAGLWRIAWVSLLAVAVIWAFPMVLKFVFFLIFLPGFYLLKTTSVLGWRGLRLVNVGGVGVSVCTLYPLGFREMASCILKRNLLRMLVLPVQGVAVFLLCTRRLGFAPEPTLLFELKIAGVLLALLPGFPMMALSSGTNDSSKWRIVLFLGPVGAAVIGCGIAFLVVSDLWLMAVLLLAMALLCLGALLYYAHAYIHNWFDLTRKIVDKPAAPHAFRFGSGES